MSPNSIAFGGNFSLTLDFQLYFQAINMCNTYPFVFLQTFIYQIGDKGENDVLLFHATRLKNLQAAVYGFIDSFDVERQAELFWQVFLTWHLIGVILMCGVPREDPRIQWRYIMQQCI